MIVIIESKCVSIGMHFKFNFRNCIVTKVYEYGFAYDYVNTAFASGNNKKLISFAYWKANIFFPHSFSQPILKGDNPPVILKDEYHKRELRRFKDQIRGILAMHN
jgi:hypothetical protein